MLFVRAHLAASNLALNIFIYTAPSITYSSCLMCWRASQQSGSEFCGSRCASAAEGQAVLLLEAPQGHVTFQSGE